MRIVAVVLAGGASKRFGADKLAAVFGGISLLDRAISALDEEWPLVVVGPERPLSRTAVFVREDPPGSGPASALVAGTRAAADLGADCVLVLPGDAPDAGRAAHKLLAALEAGTGDSCAAVDSAGVMQPLQWAARGEALTKIINLEPAAVADARARDLLDLIQPNPVPMPSRWTTDIDTPDQAALWFKL